MISSHLENQLGIEFLEGSGWVGAESGVDFGGLYDGTAGGGEPAKAGGHVQFAYRAGLWAAQGDVFEGAEMVFHFVDIEVWGKDAKAVFIKVEQGLQEFGFRAIENDADVKKFFPFDPWHYANNGILK